MANPGILRLIDGNVFMYNTSGQKAKVFYTKGDATRADWDVNEGIQVQLKDGKVIFINRDCQIYKIFN
jgi:hypothetical protein